MIAFYHRPIKVAKMKPLSEFQKGVWVYVEKPTIEELGRLATDFDLDRGLLDDAIDPFEVPRVERHEKHTYMFTRVPTTAEGTGHLYTITLLIVHSSDFVLTISPRTIPFLEQFVEKESHVFTTQKTKFIFHAFFALTRSYNRELMGINRKVREVSAKINKVTNSEINQLVAFEGALNDYLAALIPTKTLLDNILTGKVIELYEEDADFVEDLVREYLQLIDMAKSTLRNITNVRNAFTVVMTNNLNNVIKLLTALTIVLTVPTMIASFFGMNVSLPFANTEHAFAIIGFGALALSVVILLVFARKKWL